MHAKLNPTENRDKLYSAIGNILNFKANLIDFSSEEFLAFSSEDINSLKPLFEKLREQKILEAARSFFLNIKSPQFLMFHLNRQAAYVNRIHLCLEERESPLGPITVIVHSKKIEKFIDWLTPPTFKGRPINLDREQLSLEDL